MKEKNMLKLPTGQFICRRCNRHSPSAEAFRESHKIWRRKMRRPITSIEKKVLQEMLRDKLPESEINKRLEILKTNISKSHKIALEEKPIEATSFSEAYRKMTRGEK